MQLEKEKNKTGLSMTLKAHSKLKLFWTAASLNWLWHAWLEYRWQAGIISTETEQMQIISCSHMKNYFNLEVSGAYPCALRWEFLQTWGGSSAPPGWCKQEHLGCWMSGAVTLNRDQVKQLGWRFDGYMWFGWHIWYFCQWRALKIAVIGATVMKYWRLLKGKYLVKNL